MNKRHTLQRLAACALAAAAPAFLVACSEAKPSFTSVDVTGADYAKAFELSDHNGKVRHLTDFAGKVVVMFFGYTQCPDVCPTTMADMAGIKKSLGADGERLQVLFVTVDPERDTPELLKAYMVNFDPSFLALVPTAQQLPEVTRDFKIYYKKVEGETPTSYSMDHSAGSYIFDAKGQLRLFTRYGSPKEALTKDIQTLLKAG
ncbi:SCO family protein [Rhodoferax lacus]|uniref:SCO family protein n=1 Tax=Rhodoferax lacus TaxID=2184758 RepID=A0A3E1RF76_9BURK|nr:SCO family protein [Rhodoferax lacus]RFO97871.1 SCO family protein [Rhodoferax lacus]